MNRESIVCTFKCKPYYICVDTEWCRDWESRTWSTKGSLWSCWKSTRRFEGEIQSDWGVDIFHYLAALTISNPLRGICLGSCFYYEKQMHWYGVLYSTHSFTTLCVIYPQIKVQQLEGQLFTEVKTNKEHTFQMVQLRQDIHQHEWALSSQPAHYTV